MTSVLTPEWALLTVFLPNPPSHTTFWECSSNGIMPLTKHCPWLTSASRPKSSYSKMLRSLPKSESLQERETGSYLFLQHLATTTCRINCTMDLLALQSLDSKDASILEAWDKLEKNASRNKPLNRFSFFFFFFLQFVLFCFAFSVAGVAVCILGF